MDGSGIRGGNLGMEREGMDEKTTGRVLRWVLRVENRMPGYLVKKELQKKK